MRSHTPACRCSFGDLRFALLLGILVSYMVPAFQFETHVSMGQAVIDGVIASMLLTLFLVPCVYELLARFGRGRGDVVFREKEIVRASKEAA